VRALRSLNGAHKSHRRRSWVFANNHRLARVGSATAPVSNWLLFNLQLHSDHHAHMNRPFEQLRTVANAPQLPAGYPTMVLLALLPPLWFAVMDPRVPALA
jgi:fatty acid desaturase